MGHFDEAIDLYKDLLQTDPLHINAYKNFGVTLYYAGYYQEAINSLNKGLELLPTMSCAHFDLAGVRLMQLRPKEALVEAEKEHDLRYRLCGLAVTNHALGRKKESDSNLAQLITQTENKAAYLIAEVYAFRGETDRAFEWLQRAYLTRDDALPEIKGDPLLKTLRNDPRYKALLKKLHLPL